MTEEQRVRMQHNYIEQMDMLGYDPSGFKKNEEKMNIVKIKKSCKNCKYQHTKDYAQTPCNICKRNYQDHFEPKGRNLAYIVTYNGKYVRDATEEEIKYGVIFLKNGQCVEIK